MRVLLVSVPSRRHSADIPLGLFSVAAILKQCGVTYQIRDLALPDTSLQSFREDALAQHIESFKPDIIGYSGIATSYGRTKVLAKYVSTHHRTVLQIAGGMLASVADLLLKNACLDLVFHGEVERSLPEALQAWEKGRDLHSLPGTSSLWKGEVVRTPSLPQVEDLDELPQPDYSALDLTPYVNDVTQEIEACRRTGEMHPAGLKRFIERTANNPRYLFVSLKRGCPHACIFCYRHMRGVRTKSVSAAMAELSTLRDQYSLGGFGFCDECFNHDRDWLSMFCKAFRGSFPEMFFMIGGARVDFMNKGMLNDLRDSGCVKVNYGQESGSDSVLRDYRKGATVAENLCVTRQTLEAGMLTNVQLLLGGPSETMNTVRETAHFLHSSEVYEASINHLIPLPGTPCWDTVMEQGMIKDVESYLDHVAEVGGTQPLVNLTRCHSGELEVWTGYLQFSMDIYYGIAHRRYLYALFSLVKRLYLRTPAPLRGFVRQIRRSLPAGGLMQI